MIAIAALKYLRRQGAPTPAQRAQLFIAAADTAAADFAIRMARLEPSRPQDVHVRGHIVQAMVASGEGKLGPQRVSLANVTRIIAIGSDRMMNAVRMARHGALAPYLNPAHVGIGSINSPMQCMMKEVCAQCLQRHVDPATGREEFIFSCYNQDRDLDRVDFANLQARLRQNSVQEKLSNLWFEHLLDRAESELTHV